ncbi:hypothetical protein CGLAU_00910 [Corynebacterium glaucum]|uniref:Flp pilus-assembly TadG-like N-terminal domain-containing protein n=1 Tax=Corynebacterium glaucum TaxID=187491 RepID=A0A1Q2HTK7_9CORY|nr:Rv3654c family TadE-like protein [Corynebacterium glaucum]AQQ14176.1 hypothetical protein CGLAU_00910 [Corynebacterium glaucum]WJZ06698.1 hypothetical protein CGLAUT_00925 [Corynebacterium glaucum]
MSTVTSAGIAASVIALAVGVAAVGAQVADSHRSQVAADLSAVSAATALYQGADACDVAARTAALNGAAAQSCDIVDGDVRVTVSFRRAEATARAGPA